MPVTDRSGDGIGAPATHWFQILPSDTADLPFRPRAIYLSTVTTCVIQDIDGSFMTLVTTGYHAVRPIRVWATGTTATGIYGLY